MPSMVQDASPTSATLPRATVRTDPSAVIARVGAPFLRIDPAEAHGQIGNVCFAEGLVAFNGEWRLYVGLGDSRLGVTTAPMPA